MHRLARRGGSPPITWSVMTTATLLYFNGCPHWETAAANLAAAAEMVENVTVIHEIVDTPEEAERRQLRGSPTILVDGVDPFADPDAPVGLSCRVYRGPDGITGSPTMAELAEAIRRTTALRPDPRDSIA